LLIFESKGHNKTTSIIEFVFIFGLGFGFNLIPFAGPSNLLIASNAAIALGTTDTTTLVLVGVLIAFGAALAKGIHYMVTFFVSGRLSQKRQAKLNTDAALIKKWAIPLLYLVAATPLPDEPVVIPLGLMKYNPLKFFSAYFLGKLTIAVAGAFLGNIAGDFLLNWFTPEESFIVSIVVSVVLTVVITVILLKVDLKKLTEKYFHHQILPNREKEKTKIASEEPNRDE